MNVRSWIAWTLAAPVLLTGCGRKHHHQAPQVEAPENIGGQAAPGQEGEKADNDEPAGRAVVPRAAVVPPSAVDTPPLTVPTALQRPTVQPPAVVTPAAGVPPPAPSGGANAVAATPAEDPADSGMPLSVAGTTPSIITQVPAVIPSSIARRFGDRSVVLGQAYSDRRGTNNYAVCVTGQRTSVETSAIDGPIEVNLDASYWDIVNSTPGETMVNADLEALTKSPGAMLASDMASTDLRLTLHVYRNFLRKTEYINPATLSRSDSTSGLANPEQNCGTDFVSQIDYGAHASVLMAIDARTVVEKDKLKKLFKIKGGHIVVDAEQMKKFTPDEWKDLNFRVVARTFGPWGGLNVSDSSVPCALGSPVGCVATINDAIDAMQGSMIEEMKEKNNWIPVAFRTTKYNRFPSVASLAAAELKPAERKALTEAWNVLSATYLRAWSDVHDAEALLARDLGQAERKDVEKARDAQKHNLSEIRFKIERCVDEYKACPAQ